MDGLVSFGRRGWWADRKVWIWPGWGHCLPAKVVMKHCCAAGKNSVWKKSMSEMSLYVNLHQEAQTIFCSLIKSHIPIYFLRYIWGYMCTYMRMCLEDRDYTGVCTVCICVCGWKDTSRSKIASSITHTKRVLNFAELLLWDKVFGSLRLCSLINL